MSDGAFMRLSPQMVDGMGPENFMDKAGSKLTQKALETWTKRTYKLIDKITEATGGKFSLDRVFMHGPKGLDFDLNSKETAEAANALAASKFNDIYSFGQTLANSRLTGKEGELKYI